MRNYKQIFVHGPQIALVYILHDRINTSLIGALLSANNIASRERKNSCAQSSSSSTVRHELET